MIEFPKLYSDFAKYYDRLEGQYRNYPRESLWLKEILDVFECKQVLDVSCGTATHILDLARSFGSRTRNLLAMDASKEMLLEAKRKESKSLDLKSPPGFLRADFLAIPFRKESFDAAVCMYWSLAGLEESQVVTLFKEINSILKLRGLFIFDVENSEGIKRNLIGSPFIDSFFEDPEEKLFVIRANFSTLTEKDLVDWRAYYLVEREGVSELINDRMKLRFYSRSQLEKLLLEAGFRTAKVLSGPGEEYREGSFSLYFVAEKGSVSSNQH